MYDYDYKTWLWCWLKDVIMTMRYHYNYEILSWSWDIIMMLTIRCNYEYKITMFALESFENNLWAETGFLSFKRYVHFNMELPKNFIII